MNKYFLLVLPFLGMGAATIKAKEKNKTQISISSRIEVDEDMAEEMLREVTDDGKMMNQKYASLRGVHRVETTVNQDECSECKDLRCAECGGQKNNDDGDDAEGETKCASCGGNDKPKKPSE